MDPDSLRSARLCSHLLTAPAATVTDAAEHLLATQAQEFWAGRWALATRASGEPGRGELDAAFDRGDLVRTWTQRGTLHIVRPADVAWMLSVTGERQRRAAAGVLRGHGIEPADVDAAERAITAALAGDNRLTRAEFAEVLRGHGVDPERSRGNHILSALAVRGVLVLGPVVPRPDAPTRDQYLVAADTLPGRAVDDPAAELVVGYLRGHGPAGVEDFRWWAGLPVGLARQAFAAAGDRIVEVDEGRYAVRPASDAAPSDASTAEPAAPVIALGPFDEYYLSYADRTAVCAPDRLGVIGPSLNGIVKPVLVHGGSVVGTWSYSTAVGRHHTAPVPTVFDEHRLPPGEVEAALARFARFMTA